MCIMIENTEILETLESKYRYAEITSANDNFYVKLYRDNDSYFGEVRRTTLDEARQTAKSWVGHQTLFPIRREHNA